MGKLSQHFQYVLDYYIDGSKTVDNSTILYDVLIHKLAEDLKNVLNSSEYKVKGSMGNGNKSEYPWVAILNKNITSSTQYGIYIVFLFKKDMSGFYLVLNQGITHFEKLFGKRRYEFAQKVNEYFRSQLSDTSFSTGDISLGGKRGDLGYGYEQTSVVAKYYPSKKFSDEMIINDLEELMGLYDEIVLHMATKSYDDVIKGIVEEEQDALVDADTAIERIKDVVDPDDRLPYGFNRTMQEVKPYTDRSYKFRRLTSPKTGKIDHLRKAARDAEIGLLGEELAIKAEQERLSDLGFEDLSEKITWVSKQSDAYGYDIRSYDVDESGNVFEIYIEVKTTINRVDTEFFVSKNEVERSKEYDKHYCVYRIYDAGSEYPKFYKVFGKIEDNFILDPVTFMARYKY